MSLSDYGSAGSLLVYRGRVFLAGYRSSASAFIARISSEISRR